MKLERPYQPPIRSLLYVPGNKLDWMLKSAKYGADALIFDLEDSVPDDQKVASRAIVRKAIEEMHQTTRTRLFVRINSVSTGLADGDIEAIVGPGLFGIQASKIEGAEAVRHLDTLLARCETKAKLPAGQIFLMPLIEDATGVREAYEIAMAAARVAYLQCGVGATGPLAMGDMARSVGFREVTGHETAYLLGKVVLDARAAGIANPCTGLTSAPIKDLDAVRALAQRGRNFGYLGANLIHPSHVPIVNEVFGASQEEIDHWTGLVAAVEEAQKKGTAAVVYKGKMVDIAHYNYSREMLKRTAEYVRLS